MQLVSRIRCVSIAAVAGALLAGCGVDDSPQAVSKSSSEELATVQARSTTKPRRNTTTSPTEPVGTVMSCADWYKVDTSIGRIVNNVWNKQAAGSFASEQCIWQRGVGADIQYGWSWKWPDNGTTIYAYPQTLWGWKPWDGGASTHPSLPIRVSALQRMVYSHDLQTSASGRYNYAFELWITRTGQVRSTPNPGDISAELMIWTDWVNLQPAGSRIATVTIDGLNWEVWWAPEHVDTSGANANRWAYIAYRLAQPRAQVSFDVKRILNDAVARRLVSADHFVSSAESGNEIMAGSGQTWIRSMSLTVN
jgi:hypothetical protein